MLLACVMLPSVAACSSSTSSNSSGSEPSAPSNNNKTPTGSEAPEVIERYLVILGDIDPTEIHGCNFPFQISDRVSSCFFAEHSLVRHTAPCSIQLIRVHPQKTEVQFFQWKHDFKEHIYALCLLALLSYSADEPTSAFCAVTTTS